MSMEKTDDQRKIAIKIAGVKKKYRLGLIGGRTLREDLQSWWARKRGREDPTVKVDVDQSTIGQTFWALDGIDLTVRKGERLGIIGANGAGKSTLLKLLCRVTAPTEGDIYLYGRITSMLEVGTGFHGEMTGRENIYMNGAILGMSRAEIDAKIEDIIDFSEVREFIDTPVKRYSSGMFVKLAFSVAAHLDSEIMILDEVLAVGDYAFQQKCLQKMRTIAKDEGRTILYVSHNMETIRQLCDRCVVLQKGKVIFDGDVETAVGLYIDRRMEEDAASMDLSAKAHTGAGLSAGLLMRRLTLTGKDNLNYSYGEALCMTIHVTVSKPMTGVRVFLSLYSMGGVSLGSSWSQPLDFAHPGDYQVLADFSLSFIGKGKFFVSVGFDQENGDGKPDVIDWIDHLFKINVLSAPGWSLVYYGHMRFPAITAEASLI